MVDERSIQERLAEPFAHTFKKPGSNLDYITGEQVTSRLNEVLGWDGWNFRVIEHGYDESADELWCLGELTIGPTVRNQFGSQKPNRYSRGDNAGKIIDLGFDLKGAATDALKKCASLIGVGLYLHEKESAPQHREAPPSTPATKALFDSAELIRLMAENNLTGGDLIAVTGKKADGKGDPDKWFRQHPTGAVSDLIDAMKQSKQAAPS